MPRKNSVPFSERLRYWFDNFISGGSSRIFYLLVIVFLIGFGAVALLRVMIESGGALSEREGGLWTQIYLAFLQMTDPGNMAQDIKSSAWLKLPAILAGVLGLVLLSALVAFITTALIERMEALKKGHSKVIEKDHTLILGWQPQRVVEIIRELLIANESEKRHSIVILAENPKEKMDDHLRLRFPETGSTRLITRSGSTSSATNLEIVAAEHCKSVIVLARASEDSAPQIKDVSDAQCIKTILALSQFRTDAEEKLSIVCELFNEQNYDILQKSSPHRIQTVNTSEILAKILVQTSRSVGLSIAYGEILSFDGCEMYFYQGEWEYTSFGKAQFHFRDGVPMGIRRPDGVILINPSVDEVIQPDDELLILAQDDSTLKFEPAPVATARDLPLKDEKLEQHTENELIIGWNRKGHIIVREYGEYVKDGSVIDIIINNPTPAVVSEIESLNEEMPHLDVRLTQANPLEADVLLRANPGDRENIIILTGGNEEENDADAENEDAQTILMLLLLRRIMSESREAGQEFGRTRLITEVVDSANRNLIAQAGVKDFIISNRFVSMLLAQMSEEPDIKAVYDQLFSEDGSEIYLKPASLYFETAPAEVSFADCMGIAQKRGEVCLGIKIKTEEEDDTRNFGVHLIPWKTDRFTLQAEDCLVVLAEDER